MLTNFNPKFLCDHGHLAASLFKTKSTFQKVMCWLSGYLKLQYLIIFLKDCSDFISESGIHSLKRKVYRLEFLIWTALKK